MELLDKRVDVVVVVVGGNDVVNVHQEKNGGYMTITSEERGIDT